MSLVVSDGKRSSEPARARLTVVAKTIPVVSLVCDSETPVASDAFACEGCVDLEEGALDVEFRVAGDALDLEAAALTPLTQRIQSPGACFFVKLREDTLAPGATYNFALGAVDGSLDGGASLTVVVNLGPVDGTLVVAPETGAGWQALFDLQQRNWTADYLPLACGAEW